MNASPEAAATATPDDIVAAAQFAETLKLIPEAVADADDPERRQRGEELLATSNDVGFNEEEEAQLNARIDQLQRVMAPLNTEAKFLFQQMETEADTKGREALGLFVTAMDAGKPMPDLSKLSTPSTAAAKRLLILCALKAAAFEILDLNEQKRKLVKIGHERKARYFESLSKFIRGEAVRKASGAVLFEGEIVLDPDRGRSGTAKRMALYHWERFRES
jgi:hypothetical protein